MAISRLSIIKFLELAIAVTCMALHRESIKGSVDTILLSATAFGGFTIILVGVFAGYMMGSPVTKRIDLFFCLIGCALFVAAGALNIKEFEHDSGKIKDYGLAKAALAIIGGALFLVDGLLTWRVD